MARLYADEDVPRQLVEELRRLGQDVVSVSELKRQGRTEGEVLADAKADGRTVVTHNRRDFEQLHRAATDHAGVVSATRDRDVPALAGRIDQALAACSRESTARFLMPLFGRTFLHASSALTTRPCTSVSR